MIVTKIFYVECIKNYPAYTGDSTSEILKFIIPSNSEEEAIKTIKNRESVDVIKRVEILYEIIEGCGYNENGCWSIINGVDSDLIYRI